MNQYRLISISINVANLSTYDTATDCVPVLELLDSLVCVLQPTIVMIISQKLTLLSTAIRFLSYAIYCSVQCPMNAPANGSGPLLSHPTLNAERILLLFIRWARALHTRRYGRLLFLAPCVWVLYAILCTLSGAGVKISVP